MMDDPTLEEGIEDRAITPVIARRHLIEMNDAERLAYDLLLGFEEVVNRHRHLDREVRFAVFDRIAAARECIALGRAPREVLNATILPLFDNDTDSSARDETNGR